jgi:FixJ family two-component response regulator
VSTEPLIAVIDDDESMRGAVVALVRSSGYDARGFASAEEFLACQAVHSFTCIITDIQMPGMSGIELKHHLAASQYPMPVIMITARQDAGLEESAIASGAFGFLQKPFEADTLIDYLERAVGE